MARKPKEQPSPNLPASPPSPSPPDGPGLSAQQFLQLMREQLDRLERDMVTREQRLGEAEQRVREAQAGIQKERAALAEIRGRDEDLAGRLAETSKRLAAHESTLKDRDEQLKIFAGKNQDLREQSTDLARQRDEAQKNLAASRQQIELQSARLAALERQVAALKVRASSPAMPAGPLPEPAGLKAAPGTAVVGESARRSRSSWSSLALTLAMLVVSAGVGVWVYYTYVPTYLVSGFLKTRPGDDSGVLAACAEQAAASEVSVSPPDVARGLLTLSRSGPNPADDEARVNQVGRSIAAQFSRPQQIEPATRPGDSAQKDTLLERIKGIDQRLAGMARSLPRKSDEASRLVALWTEAEKEKQEVEARLSALAALPARGTPAASAIQLDPAEVKAAESADTRLQADAEALRQREAELLALLQKTLESGTAAFKSINEAVADGRVRIDKALQGDYSAAIHALLQTLRVSLDDWQRAAENLSASWDKQRAALTTGSGRDLLTCQEELGKAASEFANQASSSLVAFRQALEAIGQDSDQPTKGLVLSRALTKDLQPAVDAQQAVARLARSVMLKDNLELASLVQKLSGLRRQVAERRSQIEASLRSRTIESLKSNRDRTLKDQQDRLKKRADELDQTIRQHVIDVRTLARRMEQEQGAFSEWAGLQQERADAMNALVEAERQSKLVPASWVDVSAVEYVSAGKELLDSPNLRMVRALLAGFGCLFAYLVIRVIVHSIQTWRRNQQAIEAYTRELRSAAGR